MPKKLLSLALAAAYLTVGACRFACAATMPAERPLAASVQRHELPACHHHARQSGGAEHGHQHPGPCCVAQAEGAAALLPSHPAIPPLVPVFDLAYETPAFSALAPVRSFAAGRDPPWIACQVVDSSQSGPRAPPSLLAVL
jgi:hypothetical protein